MVIGENTMDNETQENKQEEVNQETVNQTVETSEKDAPKYRKSK